MDQKVILITGASSGMGKAMAHQLIKEGHIVYGAARRVEQMKDLTGLGGNILKLDITREEDLHHTINSVIESEGRIDVLINNAGYAVYGSVEDTKIDDAKHQFEVNLFGLARLTQAVLPHMRQQKSGTIINISSMGGIMYTPLGAWYHASKHALEGWSDCLRLETKPFGIQVVIIEPGIITTEFGDVMHQPLLDRSKNSAYEKMARIVANSAKETYLPKNASPATDVARIVSKAIRSKHPKTRYVVGKMARPLMFIRKYFGDRIFDKAVMSQVKE